MAELGYEGGWPNVIVAGTQKAGTTWLHNCLARHPRVRMSEPKELFYFGSPDWNTPERRRWYRTHFPPTAGVVFQGESTPSYLWHRVADVPFSPPPDVPDVAESISETLGDEVLVYAMLRSPVERALAGAEHHLAMGRIRADDDLLATEPVLGIIDLGFYARHLRHWLATFDPGQVRVLLYDDLVADPVALLGTAYAHLGLDIGVLDQRQLELTRNRSNTREEIRAREGIDATVRIRPDRATIERLATLYAPDIAYVEGLTGRDLSAWSDVDGIAAAVDASG